VTVRDGTLTTDIKLGSNMVLKMEPALPYIYLPKTLYEKFTQYVNAKYASVYDEPVCNFGKKACVFPESCDRVQNKIYLTFAVNDNQGGKFVFSIDKF
jgi:hypothetical protein